MSIVTYTDYGDTCDMHSRLLGTYKTHEEAEKAVQADMEERKASFGKDAVVFSHLHEVWADAASFGEVGCIWDIMEVAA